MGLRYQIVTRGRLVRHRLVDRGFRVLVHARRLVAVATIHVVVQAAAEPVVPHPSPFAPTLRSAIRLPRVGQQQPTQPHADQRHRNGVVAHAATKIASEFHAATLTEVFHGLIDHRPRSELLLQRTDRVVQPGSGIVELTLDLARVRPPFPHETCSFTRLTSLRMLAAVRSGARRVAERSFWPLRTSRKPMTATTPPTIKAASQRSIPASVRP